MIIILWNFITLNKNNMKQIIIKDEYLYYTEVQIEKVNFWMISNDPFIVPDSLYCIYHCKKFTLAKALEEFHEDHIQPFIERKLARKRNRTTTFTSDPILFAAMSGAVLSRYIKKVSEEKPDNNDNII